MKDINYFQSTFIDAAMVKAIYDLISFKFHGINYLEVSYVGDAFKISFADTRYTVKEVVDYVMEIERKLHQPAPEGADEYHKRFIAEMNKK